MERTDVVIGACGGYPKDINLYQATKAHMNAIFALKPGGILILAMACPDIMEPPAFTDWFSGMTYSRFWKRCQRTLRFQLFGI